MKSQRTRNAARNVAVDGMLKLANMLLPFFMRSIVLYYLGKEYLGLGGLFTSTISILNLAEMGVGAAMVFSMYRPIAENDTQTICALMGMYRKYYRIIGLFVAAVGMALTPFLPHLIKGHVPSDINLYILYYMNLAATVLTYWLFAYKNSLLQAHQRIDVGSRITLGVNILQFIVQLLSLMVFRNYYLFLGVKILCQITNNILIALRVGKMYPKYAPRGSLPMEKVKDINRRIRDFFTSRFSAVIFNSADTLVISAYMGLEVLAVYQNYFFIITSLRTMIEVVVGACIAGIGNSLVTEGQEKNYRDLRRMTMLFGWLMCVTSAMLLCLYQPFMRLWMGEKNMLGMQYVICFVIYYYCMGINKLVNMFKDAAGIWHRDRFRPLCAAIVNLTLNLLTVDRIGLYGVLLSSVVSIVLIQIPWLMHNLFHEIFPVHHMKEYIRSLFMIVLIAIFSCTAAFWICRRLALTGIPALFANGAVSFVLPNAVFLLIYGRNPMFIQTIKQIFGVILRRKKKDAGE